MTQSPNAHRDATRRLVTVLRAENDALAAGDAEAAVRLLPEKQEAATALQATLSIAVAGVDRLLLTQLQTLAEENRGHLARAIEVQSSILQMVGRAARMMTPGPVTYRANGAASGAPISASAMAFRLRA